jgi:hypothetical protein
MKIVTEQGLNTNQVMEVLQHVHKLAELIPVADLTPASTSSVIGMIANYCDLKDWWEHEDLSTEPASPALPDLTRLVQALSPRHPDPRSAAHEWANTVGSMGEVNHIATWQKFVEIVRVSHPILPERLMALPTPWA